MSTLSKKVYTTIHRGKLSVDELADRIGCSSSLLYKAASPDDPVDLKLNWLIPLMEATKNYSMLHHLANRLGFVCVRIGRSRRMKPEEVAAHQSKLAEYQHAITKFITGQIEKDECLEIVNDTLTQIAGARKMVEAGSQLELELE